MTKKFNKGDAWLFIVWMKFRSKKSKLQNKRKKKFPQRDTFLILIPTKKVYNVFLPQIMFRKLFDKGNKSLREIV